MKRIIATALLVMVASLPALAQAPDDKRDPERVEQVRERLEVFKERLTLTPEQVELMRPVMLDQVRALERLRDKYEGKTSRRSKRGMARELRDIQNAADARLRTILSATQMDELKKVREERRAELRGRVGR